jgi:cell division protein FtsB/cytochrome c553
MILAHRVGMLLGFLGLLASAGVVHSQNSPQSNANNASQKLLAQEATSLLRAKCSACHNSDVKSGGIDLSTRASALATGALLPGDAAGSKLVRMVSAGKMPPTGKLSAAETDLLTRWVTAGASWAFAPNDPELLKASPLWSLQPVRNPAIPHTPYDALSQNPIDRFVFARLAAKGLKPSPLASKRALLRRVTIDLTGLPPTPQQSADFLKDRSPHAYEKVVERLLASPAYGERWGRHWLDVVRYGESNGYEQNHLRANAWPYRDYVIRAFNEDKPYPQFIAEQLAGDVLAQQDPSTAAATGFLVAGIHDTVGIQTEEGTRQQRANDLDDIVSTTGAAFLGLTVGCARCHDHKFDPISQREYYRLTACFAGVRHGERSLATPAESAQAQQEIKTLTERTQALTNQINALDSQARVLVLRQRGVPVGSRPAINARRNSDDFLPVLAGFVRFTILATRDGTEPCLDELQVFGADENRNLALASEGAKASASSLLPGFAMHQIEHLNDGKFGNDWSWISATPGTGWAQIQLPKPALIQRVVWSRDGGAIPRFDDRLPSAYRIEVSLDGKDWKTVSTEKGREGSGDYVHPDALLQAMTPEQRSQREQLVKARTALEQEAARLDARELAYIGQFTPPDPTYLLRRGDVMQRVEAVLPGAFSCISGLNPDLGLAPNASEPERRLALARWIGDARNPLTARVMVNRVWQYHFGRGLVSTPSDFGHIGEKPSHPELLDWLARDFMSHGWRLKQLHKLIVTSYTYRQAAQTNPKGQALDAGNQLLWHIPLRRMEAEAIRDAILQTSGKLDRRMGGPSFALFNYRVVNVAIYEPLEHYGPETWRRSVYQQAARSIHDELLSAFDCPESSQRAPRRDSTTTALQALNLLNGPFMQQQAGFMAERVRKEAGPALTAQVEHAFQWAFGRSPNSDERQAARALVAAQGLPSLCRALMNANEFLYY